MSNKESATSPLDTVTALMLERTKFESWIAGIEARRESTPANVYELVHKDYETKLASVVEALKAHTRELEQQAERFTVRLAELAQQEQERLDARAESELRAHVGELTEDEGKAKLAEADEALASIAAEQSVVGADLQRVHELLGAAAAEARPASPPAPEPVAEPSAQPTPPSAPAAPAEQNFDELAFLKAVVSPPGARPSVAPPASAPTPARSSRSVPAASRPTPIKTPRVVPAQPPTDAEAEPPFGSNVTANHPVVLRPSGSVEQPRTLKCAECGAMNYATEWYCERCGAELASL